MPNQGLSLMRANREVRMCHKVFGNLLWMITEGQFGCSLTHLSHSECPTMGEKEWTDTHG